MTAPVRIQLRRTKGWRKPPNTVVVARPHKWANFYRVGEAMCRATIKRWGHRVIDFRYDHVCADASEAVRRFGAVLAFDEAIWPELRSELAGKNLGCWCALCDRHRDGKPLDEDCPDCAPCHVDPLGKIANKTEVA